MYFHHPDKHGRLCHEQNTAPIRHHIVDLPDEVGRAFGLRPASKAEVDTALELIKADERSKKKDDSKTGKTGGTKEDPKGTDQKPADQKPADTPPQGGDQANAGAPSGASTGTSEPSQTASGQQGTGETTAPDPAAGSDAKTGTDAAAQDAKKGTPAQPAKK